MLMGIWYLLTLAAINHTRFEITIQSLVGKWIIKKPRSQSQVEWIVSELKSIFRFKKAKISHIFSATEYAMVDTETMNV